MTTLHQQLHWMTLTEVANSIRQRDISVSEIIESSLQRIEQVRPEINAFIEVFADEAREAATEADRRLQCGSPVGPLFSGRNRARRALSPRAPGRLSCPRAAHLARA